MAEQTKNTNVPNNVKKVVKVTTEANEFNDIISTETLTSNNLEKKIAELFGSTFTDFEGCKITDIGAALKCKLYFKPCFSKGDGLYAVKSRNEKIGASGKGRLYDFVNDVNMISASKQFDLDDLAKEILAEFVIIPDNRDARFVDRYDEDLEKIVKVRMPKNWNNYLEEVTDVVNGTRFQNPYLVVNLDLVPIISKLYGKKDPEELAKLASRGIVPKDRYQYAVNIVKIINPTIRQYILEIRRIDIKAIEELSQSIGYGMITGNIVMTRR